MVFDGMNVVAQFPQDTSEPNRFYRLRHGTQIPQAPTPTIGPLTWIDGDYGEWYAPVWGQGTVHFQYNGSDVTEQDPAETVLFIGGMDVRVILFSKPIHVIEFYIVARAFVPGMVPSEMVRVSYP
jgi:hypothetical protein